MSTYADGDPGSYIPWRVQVVLRPICLVIGHAQPSILLLENQAGERRPWHPCHRCGKDLVGGEGE